jgi:GTP pyrophosphokinase
VLGLLHTHFRPVPGTFTDYIGLPKDNGYQSLHTCVYPVRELSEKAVEFQIRTELMHLEAEFGVAAHWRYKSEQEARGEEKRQLTWVRSLPAQHLGAASHSDFVERLRRQVFEDHLVVFGAGGQRHRLPEGTTVGDYLQQVDVPEPDRVQIMVNGIRRDASYVLHDGDTVETRQNPSA